MNVRKKITIIVITVIFVSIFFSNFIFMKFFSNYLVNQEEIQISSIKTSMESFLIEQLEKYHSNVNDYAHWDDTYDFIDNKNVDDYIISNLYEETLANLDLNFMFFVEEDNSVKFQRYLDINNNEFTDLPTSFNENITKLIRTTKSKSDISNIFKLGDQFYFVLSSEITDSKMEKKANGKMFIGRAIDESTINKLEEIAGGKVSFSTINDVSDDTIRTLGEGITVPLVPVKENKEKDMMVLAYSIPSSAFEGSLVQLTLTKTRNSFVRGMNQVTNFTIIFTIIMFAILLLLFVLLGKYISRPFTKLINDVKDLDLKENEIKKLEIYGKDEFAFLSNAINEILSKIEIERYNVRENQEKLHATLTSVGDGVIAVDRNGIVDFLNPVAQKLTGWNQDEAYGKAFETVFEIINEYTREKVESPVAKVFETKKIVEMANHTTLIAKNGAERSIEDTAAPIKDKYGKVIGAVIVFRDFSEKKEKRKQIEYLSYHDQLTGLFNRRFFEEELKRLDTVRNLPLSFLYADVNGLKTFNDAFGHEYGDILIQQVSDVFKTECRADDIIARTGGDEFIFLLPNTDSKFVEELEKRIKAKIEQKKVMDINISISFGWATKDEKNQPTWNILKNAEDLMYQKKILDSSSKRNAVIQSILHTLYLKSPREDAHSKRVSILCEAIGKAYNLSDDERKELKIAGELHDIGKIAVDEVILNKPGKLTEDEWTKIRRHPETGFRLLGTSSEYYNIAEYVLAHHERWDGRGYPNGLKGEEIHWKSRIISIADSYDAMTCERSYRKALSKEEAIAEIKKSAGTQFDPAITEVFIEKVLNGTY